MSFSTIISEFEASRYADMFTGHWESHPAHEENLSIHIFSNGEVTLTGTVPRYNKRSMRRNIPLVNKVLEVDQTFIIKNCAYVKGSITCVVINRDGKESSFVLVDGNLLFGSYHLYKDTSIKHMAQEVSVRESRRSIRLEEMLANLEAEDIAIEFEQLMTPNTLIVEKDGQFQRNSYTLGEKLKWNYTPSTTAFGSDDSRSSLDPSLASF